MRRSALWSHLTVLVLGAGLAVLVTLAVTSDDGSGVDVGDTFTGTVQSYYGPKGPQPNVVCFEERGGDCGLPILGNEDMDVKVGQTLTATELWIQSGPGAKRAAFYIHPRTDQARDVSAAR